VVKGGGERRRGESCRWRRVVDKGRLGRIIIPAGSFAQAVIPAVLFPSFSGAQAMSALTGLSRRSGRLVPLLFVLAATGCGPGNGAGSVQLGPVAVGCLAFAPDGKVLAVGRGPAVTLWDTRAGKEIGRLTDVPGGATCLAYRPDGRRLAVGSGDNAIVVF